MRDPRAGLTAGALVTLGPVLVCAQHHAGILSPKPGFATLYLILDFTAIPLFIGCSVGLLFLYVSAKRRPHEPRH